MKEPEEIIAHYRALSDDALENEYSYGPDGFRDPAIWQVIASEYRARRIGRSQEADDAADLRWVGDAEPGTESPIAGVRGPTEEDEQAVVMAAKQIARGVSREDVRATLVEGGLDQESSEAVIDDLIRMRSQALLDAGKQNMLYGALWCIGGAVVTVFTYAAATERGGSYLVA